MSPLSRPCWQLHIYWDLAPALEAGRPAPHLPKILFKAHFPGRAGGARCCTRCGPRWGQDTTWQRSPAEPTSQGGGSSEYPIFQPGTVAPSTFKSIQWDEVRREWGQADWRKAGPPCEAEAGAGQCRVSRLCPPGLRCCSNWRQMIRRFEKRHLMALRRCLVRRKGLVPASYFHASLPQPLGLDTDLQPCLGSGESKGQQEGGGEGCGAQCWVGPEEQLARQGAGPLPGLGGTHGFYPGSKLGSLQLSLGRMLHPQAHARCFPVGPSHPSTSSTCPLPSAPATGPETGEYG